MSFVHPASVTLLGPRGSQHEAADAESACRNAGPTRSLPDALYIFKASEEASSTSDATDLGGPMHPLRAWTQVLAGLVATLTIMVTAMILLYMLKKQV